MILLLKIRIEIEAVVNGRKFKIQRLDYSSPNCTFATNSFGMAIAFPF